MSVRPFSPSESFAFPKPPVPQQATGGNRSSDSVSDSSLFSGGHGPASPQSSATDPFADPKKPEFVDVEVIRRPFIPTMNDELAVLPGEEIHIMEIFDDGWAFVEKMTGAGSDHNERGLIPVECLREIGQALPAFLVRKRVSSYGVDVGMWGTAL
ncbi:hypothetical protein PAXRUDRAFT_138452 [Paxillus rubicundulus Ve08.2h10]|uniref:SH3 domain-containing protein n=1 Tax=Paxillus rubicundulus Ve08.2h10 TaxID=930991 RepID=A0A0D0EAA9_9AGAM|nr:hypothetical protein PAXRUDRAFT_138452 [Paxillus rubicundulus Ve08.2h10]